MDGHAGAASGAFHREALAHALRTWRLAEATLRHPAFAPERSTYERAVAAVAEDLRRFRTTAELVGYYASERLALHAALSAACAGAGAEPRLLASVVEGAAFWRRLRELVADAVA